MKIPALLFFISFIYILPADAQYYYKDIIMNNQLFKEMQDYRNNKIRTINIKSIEDDGSPSEGFFCQKKISKDYKKIELLTRSQMTSPTKLTSYFNDEGKIVKTNDSSSISISNNIFSYDNKGRLVSILSLARSDDDDFRTEMIEEHIYYYGNADLPEKMIRVKNRYDSITILFALDENNLVSIEKDSKTGNKHYYYYDAKKRLTDVVQSNSLKHGLLPLYVFEYNQAGNITQMTASEEGIGNYLVWRYTYDNGMRVREKCYSKERRLLGSIEYEYK